VSSSSDSSASEAPSTRTSPELARSRPPIRLSSVDFPEPDGPMIDTISPRSTLTLTSSSATTWRLPSKRFDTRSSATSVFRVVSGVLVKECQRFERAHAIEEQDAVEMIRLVLGDPRRKIPERHVDPAPLAVQAAQPDFLRARHAAADVGNAQAAFPVFDDLVADGRDFGIDDRDGLRVGDVLAGLGLHRLEDADEDAEALVDLRRGEADAVILGHRVQHVVDEVLEYRMLDVGRGQRPGFGTEDRMPHVRDFQNRHASSIIFA